MSDKIKTVQQAYSDKSYKSFVENFTFENVTPSVVNVSGEEYIKEQIESLVSSIRRIEARDAVRDAERHATRSIRQRESIANIKVAMDPGEAMDLKFALDRIDGFGVSNSARSEDGEYILSIPVTRSISIDAAREKILKLLSDMKIKEFKLHFV